MTEIIERFYSGRASGDHRIVLVHGESGPPRQLNPRFDLRNHSPDGFEWGYGGSGPAQLALGLLCDTLQDDNRALRLYMAFKDKVIARLPGPNQADRQWTMTKQSILDTVGQIEAAR